MSRKRFEWLSLWTLFFRFLKALVPIVVLIGSLTSTTASTDEVGCNHYLVTVAVTK